MRVTKRQLRRIIREEKAKLRSHSNLRSRLRRIIRETNGAGGPDAPERAGASATELKRWFLDQAAGISDLDVPSAQIPALIASMDQMIQSAAGGKLKSKESQMSKQISRLGGLGEAEIEEISPVPVPTT